MSGGMREKKKRKRKREVRARTSGERKVHKKKDKKFELYVVDKPPREVDTVTRPHTHARSGWGTKRKDFMTAIGKENTLT